jgi:hypothetical protein
MKFSVVRRFSRCFEPSSLRPAFRKVFQDCPLRVSALKNGEPPKKMPIRVKNVAVATTLIRHVISLCVFLELAAE